MKSGARSGRWWRARWASPHRPACRPAAARADASLRTAPAVRSGSAAAPDPVAARAAIGFGDLDGAHPSGHEKWWLRPSNTSRNRCDGALDAGILDAMTEFVGKDHEHSCATVRCRRPGLRRRARGRAADEALCRDLLQRGWEMITRGGVDNGAFLSRLDCPLFSPSTRVVRRARTWGSRTPRPPSRDALSQ
jgi:hypothetical protein